MNIKIRKLEPALIDDYFRFFDQIAFADHPEWGCECYCCFFHATDADEWKARTVAANRAVAQAMVMTGRLQGMLAYADDIPVAWCHYDLKENLPGLKVFYPDLVEDNPEKARIASIVCFTVAQGYRGLGLAGRLLGAACDDLAGQGCSIIEAYPRTADSTVEEHYHGPLSLYLNQGFNIYRQLPEQAVVRKVSQP